MIARLGQASLDELSWRRIVAGIDAAARRFLDPADPLRAEALASLEADLSAPVAAAALDAIFAELRQDALDALLRRELGDPDILDRWLERPSGGKTRAFGPRWIAHILAGNVPAPGPLSIACGLLVKAANLVRPSQREPGLIPLFAQALAAVEPAFGPAVAIVAWPSDDAATGRAVLGAAEAVIAYGADTTIARLREWVSPRARFVAYGHRFSLAAVGREALLAPAAELAGLADALAEDVALYEQRGCLSPLAVYVETVDDRPLWRFAASVAEAMERLQARWPAPRLAAPDAARIHQLRGEYEVRELAGERVRVWSDAAGRWTVVATAKATPPEDGLPRTVFISAIPSLERLPDVLSPLTGWLQGVALAVPAARREALAARFARLGASRICSLGSLQRPPALWPHDGRARLVP
ncbi:MAG TPA: acyl-CoA reductase, partial [Limnochordia bacterium]